MAHKRTVPLFATLLLATACSVEGGILPHAKGIPQQLNDILFPEQSSLSEYNPLLKPDGLLNVDVTTYVRLLGPICPHRNTLDIQLTYRERFTDERLKKMMSRREDPEAGKITITGQSVARYLWTPDTFFRQSVKEDVFDSISENSYARIFPSGEVLVSRRIQLKIACLGFVQRLDHSGKATCNLQIASYGRSNDELIYQWATENSVMMDEVTKSTVVKVGERNVELEKFETGRCDVTTRTGTYSCISVTFHFAGVNEP